MPHAIFTRAKSVLAHSEEYPECIVSHAKRIVTDENLRRSRIAKLWVNYRTLLMEYRAIKSNHRLDTSIRLTRLLLHSKLGADKSVHNDFHKCMNALIEGCRGQHYSYLQFMIKLEVLGYHDIDAMLNYVGYINAALLITKENKAYTQLLQVSGISKIEPLVVLEIVLFKYAKVINTPI